MPSPQGPLNIIRDGAAQLEEIRVLAIGLPENYRAILAEMLRAIADEIAPTGTEQPAASSVLSDELSGNSLDRIETFFRNRANKAATLKEVADGASVPYLSLRSMLYDRHKDKFTRTSSRTGKATLWQWKAFLDESAPKSGERRNRIAVEIAKEEKKDGKEGGR